MSNVEEAFGQSHIDIEFAQVENILFAHSPVEPVERTKAVEIRGEYATEIDVFRCSLPQVPAGVDDDYVLVDQLGVLLRQNQIAPQKKKEDCQITWDRVQIFLLSQAVDKPGC